jgi:uncharacterized protein YjbI with pentapeptide repeats
MTDIKNIDGDVIYTSASPNDTIKQALHQALRARVNLQYADLQDANLQGANLRWADLREANLQGANLQEADLQGANLMGADLEEADLRGAKIQLGNRIIKLEASSDD